MVEHNTGRQVSLKRSVLGVWLLVIGISKVIAYWHLSLVRAWYEED